MAYKKITFISLLSNHWSFVIGIIGGIGCGLLFKEFAKELQPFAQLYINLLQISVIPVIIITVTTGISRMISHHHAKKNAAKIFGVLGGLLLFSSIISTFIGFFLTPGEGLSAQPEIASILEKSKDLSREL